MAVQNNIAWGLDYRKVRSSGHELGERWLTTLTRLNDGKLLNTWHSTERPQVQEVRRVLARAILKHQKPEVLWVDTYLSQFAAAEAERYHIRLHIRTFQGGGLEMSYDERVNRAMEIAPAPPASARARHGLIARARHWLN